jgi:transposase-like protein
MNPREQFCPNTACPARGEIGENNIIVHSQKEARYQCKICGKTFAATSGTPFYRLHHASELMVIVATLIAHGCPLQAIVAAYHLDERTVMSWQARVGQHCQQVHEHLVQRPQDREQVQADEIRVKGQGKIVWLAMAIMVRTRLWLGGVVGSQRDEALIVSLVQIIRTCALARPLLICVDGFVAYVQAVQQVFRSLLPSRTRGRPQLIHWPDIHIGQVVKRYQGKRVVGITRRMAQGCWETAQSLLAKSHGGTKLNTAFIERLNATFRSRLAILVRRSRALLRNPETLTPLMFLMGCVYNFCTVHNSLRVKLFVSRSGYRWVSRTPALAAGLTDHIWSVKELLLFRVPLPAWQPSKHRGRPSRAERALIARWCS